MKKLKNVLLPIVIVLIGAGTAFAGKVSKNTADSIVPGYLFNSSTGKCEQKRSNCSTSGSQYCTWMDANQRPHVLSEKINETTCGDDLFEP
jgi:hypothetical protein